MPWAYHDATIKVSPVSSPFSVNFSSSMKGSSVKLLGWARVVTRPSRAARVTSTGTMERAIIALTALTASSSLDYITWICWSVSLFVSPLFSASTTLTSLFLSHPHTIIYSIWNRIQGQHKNNLPTLLTAVALLLPHSLYTAGCSIFRGKSFHMLKYGQGNFALKIFATSGVLWCKFRSPRLLHIWSKSVAKNG